MGASLPTALVKASGGVRRNGGTTEVTEKGPLVEDPSMDPISTHINEKLTPQKQDLGNGVVTN